MALHSSTLAWKIPWMEEPGRLQSMGLPRVGHDWETSLSLFTFIHWRRKWNPLQCSCLENPRDGEAWWAAVSGVAQSQTRLKRLSSSSSSSRVSWQCSLVSAVQQCGSAVWIHVSPPSWASLPLTPIPPSWVITEHWAKLPVLYSSFPQAVCFIQGSVYTSMWLVSSS